MEMLIAALAVSAGVAVIPDDHEMGLAAARVAQWLGTTNVKPPTGGVGLLIHEQTWGTVRRGRNAFEGPLRLGETEYTHGLGGHAPSDIEVHLLAPARRFLATIGIDRNGSTAGGQGSVVFEVLTGGTVRSPSGTLTAADAPQAVDVALGGASSS